MLAEGGMKKINFSGGEPFIVDNGNHLGELVKFCKVELKLESCSVVSNGSLVKEKWFQDYGEYLDIIAVSCDSFNEEVNRKIGRFENKKAHIEGLLNIRDWCV